MFFRDSEKHGPGLLHISLKVRTFAGRLRLIVPFRDVPQRLGLASQCLRMAMLNIY